jgi:sterol desaturase/sphingolipid hydroxylase (fatty acid hydroxylase superfamily)
VAARAAHSITHGKYKAVFRRDVLVLGHVIPLALLLAPVSPLAALAGLLAVYGLYAWEHVFVMAPQEIPNS